MADIRIKDLTTTASSTASDDFIAVDGTTNGTRKLNAFSPTFGGNATVTGTLTTNGNVTINSNVGIIGKSGTGTGGNWRFVSDDGNSRWLTGLLGGSGETSYSIYDSVNSRSLLTATAAGVVQINQTTASTTTSTGALVVGNGTSGGLGVGGAVNIGGRLTVGTTALSDRMFYVSGSTGTTGASQFSAVVNPTIPNTVTTGAYGLYLGTNIAAGATVTNAYSLFIAAPDYTGSTITNKYGLYSNDTNPSYFAGKVSIADSSASTSTSSGALVVSGGVGVAKRIHSGEGLTTNGDNETQITFTRNGTISVGPTSAATPKLAVGGGLQLSNTSQSIPAWGDVGVQLSVAGAVLTDTSSSGTVARIVTNSIASSALAASSTTTYTAAASLFIAGGPTANTNVTITNAYAIYTAAGRINFQGLPTSSAGLQAGTLWNDSGTLKVA